MTATRRVAIIGPGRLGNGLARALDGERWSVVTLGRNVQGEWAAHLQGQDLILIAVPDDAIGGVAEELAGANAVSARQIVLHTSGARDRSALGALAGRSAGLGSFAPVQTVVDPATAAARLRGAYVVLEGDPPAIAMGQAVAKRLAMHGVELTPEAKVAYHAGAVMVANLGVALEAMAERVATVGGVPAEAAAHIYLPLWQGMIANLVTMGAAKSLTGPVKRGDVETIRRHLALLQGAEREVYVALSGEAIKLAERAGMAKERVVAIEKVLRS